MDSQVPGLTEFPEAVWTWTVRFEFQVYTSNVTFYQGPGEPARPVEQFTAVGARLAFLLIWSGRFLKI